MPADIYNPFLREVNSGGIVTQEPYVGRLPNGKVWHSKQGRVKRARVKDPTLQPRFCFRFRLGAG